MFNPVEKFWFALARNAEGGEGGGGAVEGSGSTPAPAAEAVVAGAEPAAPTPTFLSQGLEPKPGEPLAPAAPLDPNAPPAEPAPVPTFDLATLTMPEGFEMNEEVGKGFAELLNKADLSPQERGQQLLDLHSKTVQDTVTKVTEALSVANKETWTKMNNDWRDAIKELPEFKSDPDAEAGHVLQALSSVGAGPEFFAALDLTGAGNHPAILQVLHRLTKPFREGGAVGGTAKPASTKQLGENIYTSANKS